MTLELKETLDPLARQHGSKTIQDIFDAYYQFGEMVDYKGYMQAVADRSAMVREWGVFLEEWPLVLSPFFMRPMYDYDHDETFDGARDLFDAMMYSYSINYMGFPAGNIPIGLVGGRPCGVQIIGRRFREDRCCWIRTTVGAARPDILSGRPTHRRRADRRIGVEQTDASSSGRPTPC